MARPIYNLPSFRTLAAFEAAARHRSFKAAAEELNVTPGAISHHVRALEAELGQSLFERVHRGVELTASGRTLFEALRSAFLDLAASVERVRRPDGGRSVTVGATTAMSALWLMPTISRFWQQHPRIGVNQVLSDALDFAQASPELIVSYGPMRDSRYTGQPLFRDTLVPVCSPSFAARYPLARIEDLLAAPLVHMEAPDRSWSTWDGWFGEHGITAPLSGGTRVNNYMIALQAAEDGAGLALGWRKMIGPRLASGRLVALDAFAVPAPTSFFLMRDQRTLSHPAIAALADRLLSAGRALSGETNSPEG